MKKVLFSLWFILSAGALLLLLLYGFLSVSNLAKLVLPTLTVISLAAAILLLLPLRRHLDTSARFLFVLWMAIISGAMAGILLLGIAAAAGSHHLPIIPAIIVLALVMILLTILLQKRPLASLITAVVFIVFALGLILTMAAKQEKIVEETTAHWKAKGLPVTLEEVIPKASTEKACKTYLKVVGSIRSHKEMDDFYHNVIADFCTKAWGALAKGEALKPILDTNPIDGNPRWENLVRGNEAVLTALPSCPYVQYFDPKAYADKIQAAPIPNLLDQLYWAKGMAAEALVLAREGNFAGARRLAFAVDEGAKKFEIPGQALISNLIAIAMEKMSLTTLVAVQAIEKKPLPPEDRARLLKIGKIDPTWAASLFDFESYRIHHFYGECDYQVVSLTADDFPPLPRWRPLWRAYFLNRTKQDMEGATALLTWFHTLPEYGKGIFHWHETPREHYEGIMMPNMSNAYMRLVALAAATRLADAVDQLLAYNTEHHRFPEKIEDLSGPWPIDPFTDKPLIYTKVGERDFIVASYGADEKQGDPKKLYVWGIMRDNDVRDIGYHIAF